MISKVTLRFVRAIIQLAVAVLMALPARAEPMAGAASRLEARLVPGIGAVGGLLHPVNIMDGADERGSLLALGPALGLSPDEIARIRAVSGYVGCFLPSPSVGSGALFLDNRQIITAGHILFDPSGTPRSKCFFRNQAAEPVMVDLLTDPANTRFGGHPPKAGSNSDFAIVRLVEPVAGAEPFPVEPTVPVAAGDALIVVTAHPAGMAAEMDKSAPVVQGCRVRRAPISSSATSFFRTDCDATGSSSGGMHLARVNGRLAFRGVTITAGPWQDPKFHGAPYDEAAGSATTALGTDAAVLDAGRSLAADRF
ncbi:MAG: serine protease [Pseudomonadota bacterium]|nr:serine protease [Pseudomonadota bacterium]